jgi:hypothetical protein
MKFVHFQNQIRKIFLCLLIAAGIYFASLISIAHAEDMPAFRQGMWEFNRTIESTANSGKPQSIKNNRCTNPTDDMKKQKEMLSKLGCKLSSANIDNKTYSFNAECKIQNNTVQTKSVITVENDSAYNIRVESQSGDQITKEQLQARRTGDCTKDK